MVVSTQKKSTKQAYREEIESFKNSKAEKTKKQVKPAKKEQERSL